jgi:hypothetical protein
MGCCGGGNNGNNQENNHDHHNNKDYGNSNSGSRIAIIIGVALLAGLALYFIR